MLAWFGWLVVIFWCTYVLLGLLDCFVGVVCFDGLSCDFLDLVVNTCGGWMLGLCVDSVGCLISEFSVRFCFAFCFVVGFGFCFCFGF